MPKIKGIKTDNKGNVEITPILGIKHNLTRTDLIKSAEDKDVGLADKTKNDYDVYTHCFEDTSMKNPKRTITLVCDKSYILPKEWWKTDA